MINRLEQLVCELRADELRTDSKPVANSTFAIGGVSCSADSFAVTESAVLRMNPAILRDAKKPAHRKSAKRMKKK